MSHQQREFSILVILLSFLCGKPVHGGGSWWESNGIGAFIWVNFNTVSMGSLYPLPTVIYSSILSNITRSIFPPAFPSALLLALKPLNSGVCSIRSPVEWVNPRGVSQSYGCPEGPPSQGDLRGSSPQRKRDYRGRMVEKRPSTVCVWTGVGLGWRRLRLKTYWIEGPRGRAGGRGGKGTGWGART